MESSYIPFWLAVTGPLRFVEILAPRISAFVNCSKGTNGNHRERELRAPRAMLPVQDYQN